MEYLYVLHRLFHENMGWLTTHYLPIESYRCFLQKNYPNLYTHFSFALQKRESQPPLISSYKEFPFYAYHIDIPKEGYSNILFENDIPEQIQFLCEALGYPIEAIEKIHLKEEGSIIYVELFLRVDFELLTPVQLCYYYHYKQIKEVNDNIKQHLHMLFFDEEKKEKERRNSVRKYQARLGYYLRVLEKKFQELNIKEVNIHDIGLQRSITDVYKCVCLGLEETLMYIEECYGQYMDRSLTISYLKRKNFTEKYYQKCQQLITLFKNQELPAVIETEVCKPLYAIIEDRLHTMTYIRMEYYKKYIDLFTRLLTKNPSVHHDQIYKLLMALEYNTHNVYKALEEEALLRLDQIDSVRNKQLYTFQQLSKIQNVAITSSYKYYPEFPSLKTHFIEFIRKQIDLLQLQVDLEAAAQETTSSKKTDIVHIKNKTINKRKINMTVQEMALFARLFTEIGIISVNDSKQDYFKFLANAYQSKDADELSAKSIKNAFYSVSEETCTSVENILIMVLGKLQKLRKAT